MKLTLQLLPEELVALAELLDGTGGTTSDHKRVAAYVAGAARHQAAVAGLRTQAIELSNRKCETCLKPGGVRYAESTDGPEMIEHPRCRAMRLTP